MSWDERLFGFGHAFAKKIFRRPEPALPGSISLDDCRARLRTLALALAGEPIDIREAEGVGGATRSALLLPRRMHLEAYLFRVAWGCRARTLGYFRPPALRSRESIQMATFLSVPRITAELERDLPGTASIRKKLYSAALTGAHARANPPGAPGAALLAWRRVLLGEPADRAFSLLAGPSARALRAACESAPPPEEIAPLALELERVLGPELAGPSREAEEPLWGLLLPAGSAAAARSTVNPDELSADALPSGTERRGRPRELSKDEITEVKIEENREAENPFVHDFEKVKTAEEYLGGRRTPEGSDELDEHLEALEELDLRKVIRSGQKTRSIYRADLQLGAEAADLAEGPSSRERFVYDEWDGKTRTYRKAWCALHLTEPGPALPGSEARARLLELRRRHHRQIRALRASLERLVHARVRLNRQLDGPEIDLDAVVERHATLASGHSPSGKLYLAKRRRERDVLTLILLDSSLSTDSWIHGNRVMDIARDSIVVLSQALRGLHDRVAIASFHSNTRKDCRYVPLKEFDDSWENGLSRLLALRPAGYTRIGPAIRHATALLSAVPAQRKLLILISDGKPTDLDRYEGNYGIADVRQALREAAARKIRAHALAVETEARFHLPRMFGTGNYEILPHPARLAESLARIYGTLLR